MPTYEYKCETCGTFELWQNIKDDALTQCPTCGNSVKRLISRNVNIIFKGSGFYVTDNRSDRGGGSSESATEANGVTSTSDSGSGSGENA